MKRFLALILCLCMILTVLPGAMAAGGTELEESLARDLKTLGLFRGVSETDFALNRAPTRVEALVMLIRVLGQEQQALSGACAHPFTDVPTWANVYVGHAYETGLTKGISATQFGTGDATAQMYLTFMLRALGYDDAAGDFSWSDPFPLAGQCGLLPDCVDRANFRRADAASVSYAALPAYLKNSSQTLADKLIAAGVFSRADYEAVYRPGAISEYLASRVLTAEQIFDACAPAVFYIEVYNRTGAAFASGSGFFLEESGVAVTNYHVIEGARAAKIRTQDGKIFDVSGLWAWSREEDWAILQINGGGFTALPVGQTVKTGQTVYAIGSPLGLQNTLSQGLVSTASRDVDGMEFIQISTPISSGSSGGALLDEQGRVVGITSAGFEDGQNLNLAIPITKVLGKKNAAMTPFGQTASGQEVTELLRNFVQKNANYTFLDKYPAIRLTERSYSGYSTEMVLYYDTDDKAMTVNVLFRSSSLAYASVWLSLSPTSAEHYVGYYYYSSIFAQEPSAEASGTIDAAAFSGQAPVTFSRYDGAQAERQQHGSIAASVLELAVTNLDAIFETYAADLGGAGMDSFGFK